MFCNMGAVEKTFPFTFPLLEPSVVLFVFCFIWSAALAQDSLNLHNQKNIVNATRQQSRININVPLNSRINVNVLRVAPHRRTRDTLKYSVQEELRRRHSKLPYLKKRIPSSSPWAPLYNNQEFRGSHTTSVNVYSPQTQLTSDADPFKTRLSKRISPSSQMVTVLKTQGVPSVHVVQPKDFYKSVFGAQEKLNDLQSRPSPTNLTQTKVGLGIDEDLEDVRLANEHFMKMRKIGKCHLPMAEMVCVKDFYPSETKEYLPRCTLLHRCSHRSGCCEPDSHCTPKAIQEVSLNFYTILLNTRSSEGNAADSVEKLLFENHTECDCTSVDDQPTQTSGSESTTSVTTTSMTTTTTTTDVPTISTATTTAEVASTTASTTLTTTVVESLLNQQPQKDHSLHDSPTSHKTRCQECPDPFCQREYFDGHCSCDCFDKQRPCLRIKKGREPLVEKERRCVETNRCNVPDCEFGKFIVSTGRCPKKPDHLRTKNDQWKHEYNRWSLSERD